MIGKQAVTWAGQRGITQQTLERMRVESGVAQFGSERTEAIVFGYYKDGERVNYKARSLQQKDYKQQKGGEQRFYNLDMILDGPKDVCWITEGEMDCLALIQAGLGDDSVISVPTGAPNEINDNPTEARKYAYVMEALDQGLGEVHRFIIAVDNDAPGRALRNDLVAILGAAKCWFIDWPDGVKDANEALVAWGADDLRAYLQDAQKEWPIDGIYTLDQIPEPPELELWDCGYQEWESKVKIAARTLSVVTGIPGHGKTHFMLQTWFNIARNYGIKVAILSAETGVKPHVRKFFRQFYNNKLERDQTDEEKQADDKFIGEHFVFFAHPHSRPDFNWMCDMIEAAHARYGCRAFLCDPWNKLEMDFDRRTKTETQWIGSCLDELLDMTRALDMHIQIIAHPAKPGDAQARKQAPDLYSISGSSMWANRVDQGFTVHRPQIVDEEGARSYEVDILHRKARFEELGWPCKLPMRLNSDTGCFKSTAYETYSERLVNG